MNYFLISIYVDGLLSSNENSGWRWDVDKINRVEVAENMIDLMVSRISRLPANTQDVLKLASCFGNSFDIEILSLAYGKPIEETIFDLSESVNEGLVLAIR